MAAPTPHSLRTPSGCRKSSSPPAGTITSPSGLASLLATFATSFELATPTESGSPTSSRTRARSRTAISSGVPQIRSSPRTSRNASSTDSFSTIGEVSANTSKTALLASEYASKQHSTTTRPGQIRRALPALIAERTPRARAS